MSYFKNSPMSVSIPCYDKSCLLSFTMLTFWGVLLSEIFSVWQLSGWDFYDLFYQNSFRDYCHYPGATVGQTPWVHKFPARIICTGLEFPKPGIHERRLWPFTVLLAPTLEPDTQGKLCKFTLNECCTAAELRLRECVSSAVPKCSRSISYCPATWPRAQGQVMWIPAKVTVPISLLELSGVLNYVVSSKTHLL